MALPLVTSPDIPADRLRALQTAFMAMTRDGAFVEEIGKMGQDLSPIDGDAVRNADRPHGRHAEGRDCAVQRDRRA
jgi:hypothetical protein